MISEGQFSDNQIIANFDWLAQMVRLASWNEVRRERKKRKTFQTKDEWIVGDESSRRKNGQPATSECEVEAFNWVLPSKRHVLSEKAPKFSRSQFTFQESITLSSTFPLCESKVFLNSSFIVFPNSKCLTSTSWSGTWLRPFLCHWRWRKWRNCVKKPVTFSWVNQCCLNCTRQLPLLVSFIFHFLSNLC